MYINLFIHDLAHRSLNYKKNNMMLQTNPVTSKFSLSYKCTFQQICNENKDTHQLELHNQSNNFSLLMFEPTSQ